ncbi:MAG: hypothetical protein Ta2D_09350 [Rickettsiales bacterium]|nr:MAG: hypothetical protein Ta2D_09350 [Rickettsiales bacterium]
MFKKFILLFLISFSVVFADAGTFISDLAKETTKILSQPNGDKKYLDFINKNVDVDWISTFVLGSSGRNLSDKEKQEFKTLYSKYLLQNYVSKIKDYSKEIKVTKTDEKSSEITIVSVVTKDKTNTSINVNFRIKKTNDKYLITDIIPEGISFIGSQRTDVGNSIQKKRI